jgi:hypothetical protein
LGRKIFNDGGKRRRDQPLEETEEFRADLFWAY